MSATKDFLMEVEEARDYLKREFPKAKISIINNGVLVEINATGEYIVSPIPRDDYPTSRRMKGWKVTRQVNGRPTMEIGKMVASYEQATRQLIKELGWED